MNQRIDPRHQHRLQILRKSCYKYWLRARQLIGLLKLAEMLSFVSLVLVVVSCVDSYKVGIIHMHGVVEGYYEHNNFKKFIEKNTGIPVHLLDVSLEYKHLLYSVLS